RQALRTAHAELYPNQALSEAEVTARIEEWSREDGLLVEAGAGDGAPYLFLHLTFQEYLTACHLAQRINGIGWTKAAGPVAEAGPVPALAFVDRKGWLPAWQETIVLLAGKLDDPVPLLEVLADEGKDDLFRHRLALAARCLGEIEGA